MSAIVFISYNDWSISPVLNFKSARQAALLWTSAVIPTLLVLALLVSHRGRYRAFITGASRHTPSPRKLLLALCLLLGTGAAYYVVFRQSIIFNTYHETLLHHIYVLKRINSALKNHAT